MKSTLCCTLLGIALGLSNSAFSQVLTPLVPFGSTWKYLDDGSNQGNNWTDLEFDDTAWASGPGQLGYGDGDEATIVNFGLNAQNKFITTYFRHSFVVQDPASVTIAELRMIRDDGAIVYLNGVEIWRENMPAGQVSYLTLASSATFNENQVRTTSLDPALLVAGANILAIEVHQGQPDSSDLSMDFELATNPSGPPVIVTQPESETVFEDGTVSFDVLVSGSAPFTYQWEFNGMAIVDATNAILTLTGVSTNDAGSYRVRVSNNLGSAASDKVTLTILMQGSGLVDDFEPDIDPLQWLSFNGTARATNNTEIGRVSGVNALWFAGDGGVEGRSATTRPINTLNGGAISFYIRISDGDSFPWENADLPNEGVVLEYSIDDGDSWVQLAIYDQDGVYNEWSQQSLQIPFDASSTATLFRWRQLRDSGNSNDHWALDDVMITVAPSAPTILTQPQDQLSVVGGSANFSVVVSGSRPLSFQWDFNGAAITDATNNTLVLTDITQADVGSYRVQVSNSLGTEVSGKAQLSLVDVQGTAFRIATLTTNNSQIIDHNGLTGDDRGGIAVSSSHVFYSGDQATARFALTDLSDNAALDVSYGALVSDLRSGKIYSLANETNLLTGPNEVTALMELNGATGELTGNQINLSSPVPMNFYGQSGIFAGFGRIVLFNGERVFDIEMPTGQVTDLGEMSSFPHQGCETWAFWGVAEYFNDNVHLVYVQDSFRIARTSVPDGRTSTLISFMPQNISDTCSITVSVTQNKWYFHHEGTSLFGSGSEILGFADATFNFNRPDSPPEIVEEPRSQYGLVGMDLSVEAVAFGAEPLSYQWHFNGAPVDGATAPVLTLSSVQTNQSGSYHVVISNALGTVTSQPAELFINESRGVAGFYRDNRNQFFIGDLSEPLVQARFEPIEIFNISGFDLSTIDILLIDLEGTPTSAALLNRLPDIQSWVEAGGRLIIGDPLINLDRPSSNPLILGSAQTIVQAELGADLDFILPDADPLVNGPFGTLDNTSLDSLETTHGGFAVGQTLPIGSQRLLSQGGSFNRVVAFTYGLGGGFVHFSTIPLSFVTGGDGVPFEDFRTVYTPNLLDYMNGLEPSGPALIGASPVSQDVLEGFTARFSVAASGEPPLEFEWFFDGQSIPNATNSILVLDDVSSTQAGDYHVVASNPLGSATSSAAQLTVIEGGPSFQITSLSTNNSQVAEHNPLTGDDRGGIASGVSRLLYTGDNSTASFDLDDVTIGNSIGTLYDSLVSELNGETIYVLAEGDTPFQAFNQTTVDALLEVDEVTGTLTGNRIDLSSPIPLDTGSFYGSFGIFSGFDRIVISTGTRVYHISMPSGQVVDLGAMPFLQHNFAENWAYWGVAEYFDGDLYMVYVQDFRTIVRARVPDGQVTTIAEFDSLSDMSSITVSVRRNRWYFHHEGSSQFGGNDETIGFADATFEANLPDLPPSIRSQPISRTVFPGATVSLRVGATGSNPLSYQWNLNGSPVPDGTNASLVIANVSLANAGTYQVTVSNPLGSATSNPAELDVIDGATVFRILELTANNSDLQDHNRVTGDDRGGIAASTDFLFYTGDSGTARFSAENLSGGDRLPTQFDALFTDLSTETIYTFANGNTPLQRGGGIITTLIQIDPASGGLTANQISLSRPLTVTGPEFSRSIGIFSGYGWVLIHTGSVVHAIEISTGRILDLGSAPNLNRTSCENWAFWGLAEFFDGAFHIVYVENFTDEILRTRVPDGLTTTLSTFSNLADMCSITAVISRGRWYFHHEGGSQFGNASEAVGYADAVFEVVRPAPVITGLVPSGQILEDRPPGPISFNVVDDLTEGTNLVFSFTSTNHAVIAPENLLVQGSGTNFTLTITPLLNAAGRTFLVITATDEDDNSGSATIDLRIREINDPPLLTLGTNVTVLDNAGSVSLDNWAPVLSPGPPSEAAQTLTVTISNTASNLFAEQPALQLDGTLSFTPILGQIGQATVTLTLKDNGGRSLGGIDTSAPQEFTITVDPANQQPVALESQWPALEDQPLIGQLEGTDPDGDPLTFHLLNAPVQGIVMVNEQEGSFTYTAPAQFNGQANFTYLVNDGRADSAPATVTITVAPVNDAPTFLAGADVTVQEDAGEQVRTGWATGQSAGPADEQSQSLQFILNNDNPGLFAQGPALSVDGTLSFTPADDQHGTATLEVVLQDDGGTTNGGQDSSPVQTVTITVGSVNDGPSFVMGSDQSLDEDAGAQAVSGWATSLSAGPVNEQSQSLQFILNNDNPGLFAQAPALSADGTLSYLPADDQHGTATVEVVLEDDGGTDQGGVDRTEPQSFTITVASVNDAPSFVMGSDQAVEEDAGAQVVSGWATSLSAGPANEQSQSLQFILNNDNPGLFAQAPALSADGTLSYTPADDQHGTATVEVVLEDDGGTERGGVDRTEVRGFAITVRPVNDAPVCADLRASTCEDESGSIELPVSDADLITTTDESHVWRIIDAPAHGTVDLVGNVVTYLGGQDYNGADSFTYQITDAGGLESEVCTVSVEVRAGNDTPSAQLEVSPLIYLGEMVGGNNVLSPNNTGACVRLDGTGSWDIDNAFESLSFLWLVNGEPVGSGAVLEDVCLAVGENEVTLVVDDGTEEGDCDQSGEDQATLVVSVLSPCDAIEEFLMVIDEAALARRNKQPYFATLKSACAAFARGNDGAGLNKLEALVNKFEAQLKGDPARQTEWIGIVEEIMSTILRPTNCGDCGEAAGHNPSGKPL